MRVMGKVEKRVAIERPVEESWAALADFGTIYKWNPGVAQSHLTSGAGGEVGATRHCDLQNPSGHLEERVIGWEAGRKLKIDVYESSFPLRHNIVTFEALPNGGGSTVSVSVDYALKFGPLGALADRLFARRAYRKGFQAMLEGLKYYVETGNEVGDEVPIAG